MSDPSEFSFETRLLSVLIHSKTALRDHRIDLKPHLWVNPQHRSAAELVLSLYDQSHVPPSQDALLHELERRNVRDSPLVSDVISAAYQASPEEARSIYSSRLVELIRNAAYKSAFDRSLIAYKENKLQEVDQIWREVQGVGRGDPGENAVDIGEDDLESELSEDAPIYGREGIVKTGYPTLDTNLKGGPAAAELHLVVAPPNAGKSRFLLNLGKNACFQGKKVCYMTYEMSAKICKHRFWQTISNQKIEDLYTTDGRTKVRNQLGKIKECGGLFVVKKFDEYTVNFSEVEGWLISTGIEFDVLITDYIDLVNNIQRPSGNFYTDQTFLYAEGRRMASRLTAVHYSACQPVDKPGEVITLRAASGGKGKGATIDSMLSLNASEEDEKMGKQMGFNAKNRVGPRNFFFELSVNAETGVVKEVQHEQKIHPDLK